MPSARKILLLAGTGVVAVGLIGCLAFYWIVDRGLKGAAESATRRAPAGWMDSIRWSARLAPEALALALPRSEDGNAAAMLLSTDSGNTWAAPDHLTEAYNAQTAGRQLTGDEAAARRAILADTSLDRFVRAAKQGRWESLDIAISRSDTAVAHNVFIMAIPRFGNTRAVAYGLAIRSRMRLERGDRAAALEDARAAIGLGELMARREPWLIGHLVGRALIRIGAAELAHYGAATRDSALARQAAALEAWAKGRPGRLYTALAASPDSALIIAHDTSLALGWRAEAMFSLLRVYRARSILFGPSDQVIEQLDALSRDSDPDFARLAGMFKATAEWINDMGPRGRFDLMQSFNAL